MCLTYVSTIYNCIQLNYVKCILGTYVGFKIYFQKKKKHH